MKLLTLSEEQAAVCKGLSVDPALRDYPYRYALADVWTEVMAQAAEADRLRAENEALKAALEEYVSSVGPSRQALQQQLAAKDAEIARLEGNWRYSADTCTELLAEVTSLTNERATLRAQVARLREALANLINKPYGCQRCDSGKPRNFQGEKPCFADCPYVVARATLAETAPPEARQEPT